MKKMLAVFSAALVAAFALHADDLVVGTSFEEVPDGEYTQMIGGLSVGQRGEDFGLVGMGVPGYWYVTNDFTAVTTNYQGVGTQEPIPMRPDMFASVANSKGMEMECGTLFRTVKDVTSRWPYGTEESEKFLPQEIGGGLYFDTLVKFTAAEKIPEYEVNAKVSLSYVEHVADPEVDPSDTESFTNLVVWAGFLSEGESYPQAFRCEIPEGFDKNEFHRVTIRTIADIGSEIPGFVVYLDQRPLAYSTDVAAMDADEEMRLSAFAKTLYNSGVHQLFPSMVRHGSEMNTISCAAFSGAGAIDDVVFTDVTPAFINEDKLITLNWTDGITHITVEGAKDGRIDIDTDGEEGSREFEIDGRSDEITVSVVYDEEAGYSAGNWTASGGVVVDQKNGKFSGLITGSSCNVSAMRALCEVDGVAFDNLEDAVEAAKSGTEGSPALFKMLAEPAEMVYFTGGDEMYYVILDLNGKTLEANPDEYDSTIYNEGAYLVITNSSDTVAYVNPAAYYCYYAMGYGASYTEIYSGVWTGEIVIDDLSYGDALQLYGGTYWDLNEQEDPEEFYLAAESCCDPANVTYVGDCYFQVGGGTPPPPPPPVTFVDFVVTPAVNVEYNLSTNGYDVVVIDDVARVINGASVLVTAMPASEEGAYYDADKLPSGWVLDSFTGFASCEVTALDDPTEVTIPEPEVGDTEFVPGKTYGEVTLDDATAAWLNEYYDFGGIKPLLESMTADEFEAIYLLNLWIYDGLGENDGIKVSAITIDGDTLTMKVDLSRDSPYDGQINGKLVISGASALGEAFAPIGELHIDDPKFGRTDTATATMTIDKGGYKFFKGKVVRDAE